MKAQHANNKKAFPVGTDHASPTNLWQMALSPGGVWGLISRGVGLVSSAKSSGQAEYMYGCFCRLVVSIFGCPYNKLPILGVYIVAPDFWRLPHTSQRDFSGHHTSGTI